MKNIYLKIKTSLVKETNIKYERFSIIKDILLFIKNLKKKYKDDIDITSILQGDNSQNKIINLLSSKYNSSTKLPLPTLMLCHITK